MLSLQKPFLAKFLRPYNLSCDINSDNRVMFNFQILNPLHVAVFNPLNAELNPICHLLTLLGAHPILHISRIRVKREILLH